MKIRRLSDRPLKKKARRGFRGYPLGTVAFYGPDDQRASKAAVGIIEAEGAEAAFLERFFSLSGDVREDREIEASILRFLSEHGVKF